MTCHVAAVRMESSFASNDGRNRRTHRQRANDDCDIGSSGALYRTQFVMGEAVTVFVQSTGHTCGVGWGRGALGCRRRPRRRPAAERARPPAGPPLSAPRSGCRLPPVPRRPAPHACRSRNTHVTSGMRQCGQSTVWPAARLFPSSAAIRLLHKHRSSVAARFIYHAVHFTE